MSTPFDEVVSKVQVDWKRKPVYKVLYQHDRITWERAVCGVGHQLLLTNISLWKNRR